MLEAVKIKIFLCAYGQKQHDNCLCAEPIALGLKTPEEMFTRKKLEVSHLKIFGCPVFIRIPKEKRNKMEPS